jgi:hypothetical protein
LDGLIKDNVFVATLIATALAAVIGLIGVQISLSAAKEMKDTELQEKDGASAVVVILKAHTMFNDLIFMQRGIDSCYIVSNSSPETPHPHRFIRPLVNMPTAVTFLEAELASLIRLGKFELFDELMRIHSLYQSIIVSFGRYALLREKFAKMLKIEDVEGIVGKFKSKDQDTVEMKLAIAEMDNLLEATLPELIQANSDALKWINKSRPLMQKFGKLKAVN